MKIKEHYIYVGVVNNNGCPCFGIALFDFPSFKICKYGLQWHIGYISIYLG